MFRIQEQPRGVFKLVPAEMELDFFSHVYVASAPQSATPVGSARVGSTVNSSTSVPSPGPGSGGSSSQLPASGCDNNILRVSEPTAPENKHFVMFELSNDKHEHTTRAAVISYKLLQLEVRLAFYKAYSAARKATRECACCGIAAPRLTVNECESMFIYRHCENIQEQVRLQKFVASTAHIDDAGLLAEIAGKVGSLETGFGSLEKDMKEVLERLKAMEGKCCVVQ
jgi:hypothetical protein